MMRFYLKRITLLTLTFAAVCLFLLSLLVQNEVDFEQIDWNPTPEKSPRESTPFNSSLVPKPLPRPGPESEKDVEQLHHVGESPQKARLYPRSNEREDRILNQLAYTVPSKPSRDLQILAYGGIPKSVQKGKQQFIDDNCNVQDCYLLGNKNAGATVDAVLFQDRISHPSWKRPANQIWGVFFLESPFHTTGLSGFENEINFTATYRRDSTIVTPYERFTFHRGINKIRDEPAKDYLAGKTKMAAWFVSNCNARNGRMEYARELQKYLDVDIYGHCGQFKCPRSQTSTCFDKLDKEYKFYLAFENSNCKDYITEKLYWNGLGNDVIPVVMGARPEDYRVAAPPESYIHVDDFESPQELAKYLQEVGSNPDLYNSYFRWKGTGEFINTKFWCRLCAMVHYAQDHSLVYKDPHKWWHGPGICIGPSKGKKWSSWRGIDSNITYQGAVQYDRQVTGS